MDKPKDIEEFRRQRAAQREAYIAWHKKDEARKAAECVQKKDLVDGAYYQGHCRNAEVARWFAGQNRFTYWRTKFGYIFLEDINHPADDNGYDLFYPAKIITDSIVKEIPRTARDQQDMEHQK